MSPTSPRPSKRQPACARQSGFTLVELLIGVAALVVAAVAFAQYLTKVKHEKTFIQLRRVQLTISQDIAAKLSSPGNLYLSTRGIPPAPITAPGTAFYTGNGDFLACLFGSQTTAPPLPPPDVPAADEAPDDPLAGCRWEVTLPDRREALRQVTSFDELAPFALAYPSTREGAGVDFATPRFYDRRGRPCDLGINANAPCTAGSRNLPMFQAESRFYASCGVASDAVTGKATSRPIACKAATTFHFTYRVRLIPNRIALEQGAFRALFTRRTLPDLPQPMGAAAAGGQRQGVFMTSSAHQILSSQGYNSCHFGSVMKGTRRDGRPDCECMVPYTPRKDPPQKDLFGRPYCELMPAESLLCERDGTLFRGLKRSSQAASERGEIDCIPIEDAYTCTTIAVPYGSNVGCADGWALSGFVMPRCEFFCEVGKSGGNCNNGDATTAASAPNHGAKCADTTMTCCKPRDNL